MKEERGVRGGYHTAQNPVPGIRDSENVWFRMRKTASVELV